MTGVCKDCSAVEGEYAKAAASNGHLECLKAAKALGCPSWDYAATEAACVRGHKHCLVWATRAGAKVGYFTAQAAWVFQQRDCLEWAVQHGAPVFTWDDKIRPVFVRFWVRGIMETVAAALREEAAAQTIQEAWFRCYYNPRYTVCRRRIGRQYLACAGQ